MSESESARAAREAKISQFDPSGVGAVGNTLFGLPFTVEEAQVVIIPVPWEVTVSYSAGTAQGPAAVLAASPQIDLYDPFFPDAWKLGIAIEPLNQEWSSKSEELRTHAQGIIEQLESGQQVLPGTERHNNLEHINEQSVALKNWLKERVSAHLAAGKLVGLLGGDHSTPLGMLEALAEKYEHFGILHIDAHADLRVAYEGFTYSHASIMYNALKLPQISRLVQVGIRDQAESEAKIVFDSNKRVTQYQESLLRFQQFEGRTWADQCGEIINNLPENVYISFDIDGLDPKLCPATGTPVPGGFEFSEAIYLLHRLAQSGKKIIGFDLVEVAPGEDEWNGNVGARLLYKMCNLMAYTQGRLELIAD
jgi:agmatinase